MSEILERQELKIEHLLCFRGKILDNELQFIGRDMEEEIKKAGAKKVGYPITATYGVVGNKIDIELLIPINKCMGDTLKYHYKKQFKIENAVVAKHIGNPANIRQTCNELNQYFMDKGLIPRTVGYTVPQQINNEEIEKSIVNMYVGIGNNF